MTDAPPTVSGRLPASRLIWISVFWFAINLHWGALLTIVIQSDVAALRPNEQASTLSLVLFLGALMALVVTPIAGALSDRNASRFGRRRPFLAAGALINIVGLGVMLMSFNAHALNGYVIGFVIVQLGNNIAGGAYAGFIPDLVPEAQRGEASGFMAASTQIGTVAGALLGGELVSGGMETLCYEIIAGALLLFLILTLLNVHETPIEPPAEPFHAGKMLRDMWVNPRQYPDFAWVWVTRFLAISGIWMVQPFLLYYLRDVVGVADPPSQTGIMMAVMLVGATFTGWLAGLFSDRLGRKIVVYLANSTLAVAILLLLASHSFEFTLGVAVVFGLGYGAYYSVEWALACDVLPDQENAARYMGVWNMAMVLPQALAPQLSSALLGIFGRGTVEGHYVLRGYTAVFTTAAVILCLAAILLRNVKSVR